MKHQINFLVIYRKSLSIALVALLVAVSFVITSNKSSAAQIDTTSTSLSDSRINQAGVSYTITLGNITTGTAIECVQVEFDTMHDGSGSLPAGMSLASVALDGSSDFMPTPASWSVSTSGNTVSLVNASGENPASGDNGKIILTGITNGSVSGASYYSIVNTFSDDTCTTPVDTNGVSAFAFAEGVLITATVDSALSFDVVDSVCDLGDLPTTGTHKGCGIDFSVATNAPNGWSVNAKGDSPGTNGSLYSSGSAATIAALTVSGALGSIGAAEAFGFNLVAGNTTTPDTGTALGGDTTGVSIDPAYSTANTFYWPGTAEDTILSDTGTSPGTNATVLVGANRSAVTPAGNYSTILVLTVIANF